MNCTTRTVYALLRLAVKLTHSGSTTRHNLYRIIMGLPGYR